MEASKPLLSRRTVLGAAGAGILIACVPTRAWSQAPSVGSAAGGLSLARFTPHVGSRFTVTPDGRHSVPLTLVEASEHRPHRSDRSGLIGESFSLILGNGQPKAFEQGVHTLAHPQLGSFRVFVVPIGAGADGQRYQVVVNQRVPAT